MCSTGTAAMYQSCPQVLSTLVWSSDGNRGGTPGRAVNGVHACAETELDAQFDEMVQPRADRDVAGRAVEHWFAGRPGSRCQRAVEEVCSPESGR